MKIRIDYSKPQIRGGNFSNKKDLNAKIRLLKKEGWKIKVGKYECNESPYKYYYEATMTEKVKKSICPECGSKNIAEILYGLMMMSVKLEKQIEKGEVVLGGCCIEEYNFSRHCNNCGMKFLKRRWSNDKGSNKKSKKKEIKNEHRKSLL